MRFLALPLIGAALLFAGCGGGKSSAPPTIHTVVATAPQPGNSSAGALEAEANSAATGDIPDNQVFLSFRDPAAGYTIKYPEGWAQSGTGSRVTFRDKNNVVRVVVTHGRAPTVNSVGRDLSRLGGTRVHEQPHALTVGQASAVKVVYTTESAPNPVTGKRVTLVVDRYYLGSRGKEAIVDLGTPQGVDNVDAYRLIIESFRWR